MFLHDTHLPQVLTPDYYTSQVGSAVRTIEVGIIPQRLRPVDEEMVRTADPTWLHKKAGTATPLGIGGALRLRPCHTAACTKFPGRAFPVVP